MLSFQYIFTPDSQEKVAFSYCLGNNKEYNIRLHTFLLLSESTVVVGVDVCSSCRGSTPGNAGLNPGILPNIVHKVKTRDGERTLPLGTKRVLKRSGSSLAAHQIVMLALWGSYLIALNRLENPRDYIVSTVISTSIG